MAPSIPVAQTPGTGQFRRIDFDVRGDQWRTRVSQQFHGNRTGQEAAFLPSQVCNAEASIHVQSIVTGHA